MSMVHEVYDRGQIVIPKYIRDLLGWEKGTRVSFKVEDEKVILENIESKSEQFMKEWDEFRKELSISPKQIDDFMKNEKEYRKKYTKEKFYTTNKE